MIAKIKEEAAKMRASQYTYLEPFLININEKIGRGSFGQVFKGADTRNGNLIAARKISIAEIQKEKNPDKVYKCLNNQFQIMKDIKSDNIVKLYDVKISANNIYFIQELCEQGSLEDVLKIRKKLPEAQALIIIKQLIRGYKYLHENSVIHRNLKPENILIKDQTYKITNFGVAKFYQEGSQLDRVHKSLVGSPKYMCPEILNESPYSTKSDVWSMGVIFYQMLYGMTPHQATTFHELKTKVNNKKIYFPRSLTTPGLQQLLEDMLQYSPYERISWKEIFDLQLFKQKDQEEYDINRSMTLAKKSSTDESEISTKMSQIYFQGKKVIQQIELISKAAEEKEQVAYSKDKNQSQQEEIYKSIAHKYEETENKKDIIRKIKNWFLLKRNKAVFLNHIQHKIHKCFAMGKLNIPIRKGEIFILVLSKWQCTIIYTSYIRLKDGKINCNDFSEEQYKLFMNSNIRDKLMETFKNDLYVMQMTFDQLVKKVQNYLGKYDGDLPEQLKRIKKICNQSLCPKELFAQIYNETIDELSEVCKQAVKNDPKCREVIQLTYLVSEAMKLKKDELETNEFSMIYDQEEKLSNEELLNRIEGKFQDD